MLNNKKIIIVIASVITITLVGVGVYWETKDEKKPVSPPKKTVQVTETKEMIKEFYGIVEAVEGDIITVHNYKLNAVKDVKVFNDTKFFEVLGGTNLKAATINDIKPGMSITVIDKDARPFEIYFVKPNTADDAKGALSLKATVIEAKDREVTFKTDDGKIYKGLITIRTNLQKGTVIKSGSVKDLVKDKKIDVFYNPNTKEILALHYKE